MDIHALVVDDSGIMRKLVMRSLRESKLAQFTFEEAQDGLDAIAKFDESIQMVFVDWNMPNMSGIEFVKKVREAEEGHVPIVMITTEGTMGKVEEALNEGGVDCYIVKPFTPDVLTKKLDPLFEKLGGANKGGFFTKLSKKIA